MSARILAALALTSLVSITACDSDKSTGPNGTATVRFVNATNTNLDVATDGSVGTGNGNLAFGGSTGCINVNSSTPALTFRNAGSSTVLAGFDPNFQNGGKYVVIATAGTGGAIQFTTVQDNFVPSGGQAGLTAFNAASATNTYDVYVNAPGAALGTPNLTALTYATAASYFGVNSGSEQIRFTNAGTQTIALNAGNSTLNAGTNSLVVLGPPAVGQTALRSFVVGGC